MIGAGVLQTNLAAAAACPECGFRIFNRRYPKCESCGAALPESLVYSPAERQALLAAEDERALAKARHEVITGDNTSSSFDDSVVSAVMTLTER